MSREAYNSLPNIGSRGSPGRRLTELPTVDRSPSRDYQRGSPLGKHLFTSHSLLTITIKTHNRVNSNEA